MGSFRDHGEDVAHEVHPASLPSGALEHGADGLLQTGVSVRPDQLHFVEAAGFQRAQERRPEALVLAVADVETEHFPAAVGSDADRHDDGLGHDPVPNAGLAVGRVEEHIREVLRGEGAVAELGDLGVQARADPGHLRLGAQGVPPWRRAPICIWSAEAGESASGCRAIGSIER